MTKRGRPRREDCRECGRHIDEAGPLSKRGYCEDCSLARMIGAPYLEGSLRYAEQAAQILDRRRPD